MSARRARVLPDRSGVALTCVLQGKALPFAIKPNRHELAGWRGRSPDRIGDVADEAARRHVRGIARVVVSVGAEGVPVLSGEGALGATLPPVRDASMVGAGEAMAAGIAAALAEDARLERIARLGTAFGREARAAGAAPARTRHARRAGGGGFDSDVAEAAAGEVA